MKKVSSLNENAKILVNNTGFTISFPFLSSIITEFWVIFYRLKKMVKSIRPLLDPTKTQAIVITHSGLL